MAIKTIPLTKGKAAIVDARDFRFLNQWKWKAQKGKNTYYASRCPNPGTTVLMHRVLLHPPAHLEVDHKNGNGLDNRRCNIRVGTSSQNRCNRSFQSGNASLLKGVSWNTLLSKWQARIAFRGQQFRLGLFTNKLRAAEAYNKAAKRLHGEFAFLNPI